MHRDDIDARARARAYERVVAAGRRGVRRDGSRETPEPGPERVT